MLLPVLVSVGRARNRPGRGELQLRILGAAGLPLGSITECEVLAPTISGARWGSPLRGVDVSLCSAGRRSSPCTPAPSKGCYGRVDHPVCTPLHSLHAVT